MRKILVRSVLLASAIAMSTATIAFADRQWTTATTTFPGSIRAWSRVVPVKPGDKTAITIKKVSAGTTVTILNGAEALTPQPLTGRENVLPVSNMLYAAAHELIGVEYHNGVIAGYVDFASGA